MALEERWFPLRQSLGCRGEDENGPEPPAQSLKSTALQDGGGLSVPDVVRLNGRRASQLSVLNLKVGRLCWCRSTQLLELYERNPIVGLLLMRRALLRLVVIVI